MTIRRFLAHKNAGKSRLFAVRHDALEAVTTLGAGDVERTDDLVRALNLYLSVRDEADLEGTLHGLPDAVLLSIRRFLRSHCVSEPGTFGPRGFVEPVRRTCFPVESRGIEEYLAGACLIGLGIRAENGVEGVPGWAVVLLNDIPFVPVNGAARAWSLPDGIVAESTWVRGEGPGRQIPTALEVARNAAGEGKRVRIHSYQQGDGGHWLDGAMTTEVVVDVFGGPPPMA